MAKKVPIATVCEKGNAVETEGRNSPKLIGCVMSLNIGHFGDDRETSRPARRRLKRFHQHQADLGKSGKNLPIHGTFQQFATVISASSVAACNRSLNEKTQVSWYLDTAPSHCTAKVSDWIRKRVPKHLAKARPIRGCCSAEAPGGHAASSQDSP
jgi:hypothetical protein